jgi:hypothetical protein
MLIMFSNTVLVLSQASRDVDLRRVASERIKETPAVSERRV